LSKQRKKSAIDHLDEATTADQAKTGQAVEKTLREADNRANTGQVTDDTQDTSGPASKPLADDWAEALRRKHVPTISEGEKDELLDMLRQAQEQPPEDKQRFVDNVNRILDVHNLRIRLDSGDLVRLTVRPGANKAGYIQFSGGGGGSRGGFRKASLSLAQVPLNYRKNRHLVNNPS